MSKVYRYTSTCTKVLDGDTLVFDPLDLGNDVFLSKVTVRLNGINTPESRTKNLKEKELGMAVKKYVKELCEGKEVTFDSLSREKFGRLLGVVWVNGVNLNEDLVKRRMAREYHGESRKGLTWE